MKSLRLNTPTTVDNRVRFPIEGTIIVPDDEAKRIRDEGMTDDEPEEWPPAPVDPGVLIAMSVAELRQRASELGVNLHDLTRKADIVGALEAHYATA